MVLNRVLTLFHGGGWTGLNLTLCMPNTHMCMSVVKKEQEKEKRTFHSWGNYRIGTLVSHPLGHQGSWVFDYIVIAL